MNIVNYMMLDWFGGDVILIFMIFIIVILYICEIWYICMFG